MKRVAVIGGGPSGIVGIPVPDIDGVFDLLEGQWKIERRIPEMGALLLGSAQFVRSFADANTLDYREDGELHLLPTGEKFSTFRNFYYIREPDVIAAYFADGPDVGKLFHKLKPICSSQSPDAVVMEGDHHCGDDDYHSTYRVVDENRFDIVHRVTGPAKDYTSTTTYRRLYPEIQSQLPS